MLAHFRSMPRTTLAAARLYLIADAAALDRAGLAAVAGGVTIVQLRDRGRELAKTRALALRERFRDAGALFIVNDDPVLAAAIDADGVHLGQDDMAVERAREIVGPEALIGLSTHSTAQIDAARGVDYIGVGPVWATPTKPGYAPVGLELVRYASEHAGVPFFAIGGIDAANAGKVFAAGAQRLAVVRAISQASDPRAAAAALLEAASVVSA
jgi:thiamine-phosphate pyrophosphorylase